MRMPRFRLALAVTVALATTAGCGGQARSGPPPGEPFYSGVVRDVKFVEFAGSPRPWLGSSRSGRIGSIFIAESSNSPCGLWFATRGAVWIADGFGHYREGSAESFRVGQRVMVWGPSDQAIPASCPSVATAEVFAIVGAIASRLRTSTLRP